MTPFDDSSVVLEDWPDLHNETSSTGAQGLRYKKRTPSENILRTAASLATTSLLILGNISSPRIELLKFDEGKTDAQSRSGSLYAGKLTPEDVVDAAVKSLLVENPPRVRAYLAQHSELLATLSEARARLGHLFGSQADLLLKVTRDPEADQFEELFVYVLTDLSAADALERLSVFEEEWFLAQPTQAERLINVSLRFV